MALQIAAASRRKRASLEDPFGLYVVDSEGPPLVHVSRTRRCEIVVFGRTQEAAHAGRAGHGADLAERGRQRREDRRSARSWPARPRRRHQASVPRWTCRSLCARLAIWAAQGTQEVVSMLEDGEPARRTCQASLWSTRKFRPRTPTIWRPCWANITGKRDDAVKRTSGESSRSRPGDFRSLRRQWARPARQGPPGR